MGDWRQILVCVRDRFLRFYAFYAAFILSLVVLFTPAGGGALPFPQADKLIHMGLFAVLAATAGWRWGRWRTIVLGLLGYALVSEILQGAGIPGRQFDLVDLAADSAGLGVTFGVAKIRSSVKK